MRLIYQNNQQIGPDPVGHYVYLWRHGEIDRYVGRGINGRWQAHLDTRPNQENQKKARYFAAHRSEMAAFIIAEGLANEDESSIREMAEIAARPNGSLLNAYRGSMFLGRVVNRDRPRYEDKRVGFDCRLFSRLKAEGPFPPNALVYLLVPESRFNDLKKDGAGRRYFSVYPAFGTQVTVAAHLANGSAAGFRPGEQFGHMACDFCRGIIGMVMPSGETFPPGYNLPTRAQLVILALEIGTQEEWDRHLALRERLGCKIGG